MATTPDQGVNEHSLGDLLRTLRDETGELFKQEVALAKSELRDKFEILIKEGGAFAGGATALLMAVWFVLMAVTGVLYLVLRGALGDQALWVAPLAVAVLAALAGGVVIWRGLKSLRGQSLLPSTTLKTMKENRRWLNEKVTS